jgi:hypothetical protein
MAEGQAAVDLGEARRGEPDLGVEGAEAGGGRPGQRLGEAVAQEVHGSA